ncbi:DNA cytosine methyltransferase [Aliidiomarina haloalkalitolerans]|uniref:Cytosine-specific methyltransferase n=1 Tax=Aliidiomarina haloalkalitolerans TaxID=859059 RepID=A0A432VRK3_9GAMM|nr:DNA (cytosine-5-)-methyltransferase [Aliidiomarina haloalkalitolerans]RUO18934.1 DNA (cytosine-5-)-methyltransferase [Aliidiomarina haloalkalitolerans]
MKNKRLLSLFSGCGGMDLGFEGGFKVPKEAVNPRIHKNGWKALDDEWVYLEPTSFETVFSNDILPNAEAAWKGYFGEERGLQAASIFRNESIVDLVKRATMGEKIFPSNVDIVTGGFPCQDFSVAGKRNGFHSHKNHLNKAVSTDELEETRGKLYVWMRKVIEITKPKVFIAENVKGLISLGEAKRIIEKDFSSIDENGFLVVPARVLNAADYGVAQKRERIIFIGLNKSYLKPGVEEAINTGEVDIYPQVTHSKEGIDLMPYTKVKHYFRGLQEPEESEDPAQQKYSKARYCPGSQGQIEVDIEGLSPTIRAEHHGNIEYRRLASDKGGRYINELLRGKLERRLTVRECARIQTFPDEFKFVRNKTKDENYPLSASGAYKVIGNAVPPLLAFNIAKRLELIWHDIFSEGRA